MKSRLILVPRPVDTDDEVLSEVDDSNAVIVGRPDGFYWVSGDGRQEFGPFGSSEEACADRDRYDDRAPEPGETLQEAEADLGIADWIDPDTGGLAEGLSTPHLVDE